MSEPAEHWPVLGRTDNATIHAAGARVLVVVPDEARMFADVASATRWAHARNAETDGR